MVRGPRIPVLAYHAMNVAGDSYESNDHVALAHHIEALTRRGIRVVALSAVVAALESRRLESLAGCVAITFDDGSDFDFHDLPHPRWGVQPSMLNVLREAKARGGQPTLEATSFVIVFPEARAELSRWLLSESIAAIGAKRAVFAYTGNTMSQRDTRALDFRPAAGRYLLVQWHGEPAASRASLVARIAALGPF